MSALAAMRWPEIADGTLLVLPIGSCEQHGPHFPFGTDTIIATALADRLAAARPGSVVAPALAYGASGEHADFPGTLSVGLDALQALLVELVRSADHFAGTVIVSAHGGNAAALVAAVALLRYEQRRVLGWSPPASVAAAVAGGRPADAHAGWVETSLLLELHPGAVALRAAEAGETRPVEELMAALRDGGVAAVSPNGVLGDPAGSSAELGRRILQAWAEQLIAAVAAWDPLPIGPRPGGS